MTFILNRSTLFAGLIGAALVASVLGAERYGGVEIGAKGVKFAVVEIDRSAGETKLIVPKIDAATSNVTISDLQNEQLSPERIKDVVDATERFAGILEKDFGVPRDDIQVVVSSGVPFAPNLHVLSQALQDRLGFEMQIVTGAEEGYLQACTTIPQGYRHLMTIVDIGSGSTKGGQFRTESDRFEDFDGFLLPFGSKTFAAEIAKTNTPVQGIRGLAAEKAATAWEGTVPAIDGGDTVRRPFFTGGAVWAMVTMMKPERSTHPYVRIDRRDAEAYLAKLEAANGGYPPLDLSRVSDPAVRAKAQEDYDKITGAAGPPIFKPEELLAGASLIVATMDRIGLSDRPAYFDSRSITAWITAKITPPEFRYLLPEASGRIVQRAELVPAPTADSPRIAVSR